MPSDALRKFQAELANAQTKAQETMKVNQLKLESEVKRHAIKAATQLASGLEKEKQQQEQAQAQVQEAQREPMKIQPISQPIPTSQLTSSLGSANVPSGIKLSGIQTRGGPQPSMAPARQEDPTFRQFQKDIIGDIGPPAEPNIPAPPQPGFIEKLNIPIISDRMAGIRFNTRRQQLEFAAAEQEMQNASFDRRVNLLNAATAARTVEVNSLVNDRQTREYNMEQTVQGLKLANDTLTTLDKIPGLSPTGKARAYQNVLSGNYSEIMSDLEASGDLDQADELHGLTMFVAGVKANQELADLENKDLTNEELEHNLRVTLPIADAKARLELKAAQIPFRGEMLLAARKSQSQALHKGTRMDPTQFINWKTQAQQKLETGLVAKQPEGIFQFFAPGQQQKISEQQVREIGATALINEVDNGNYVFVVPAEGRDLPEHDSGFRLKTLPMDDVNEAGRQLIAFSAQLPDDFSIADAYQTIADSKAENVRASINLLKSAGFPIDPSKPDDVEANRGMLMFMAGQLGDEARLNMKTEVLTGVNGTAMNAVFNEVHAGEFVKSKLEGVLEQRDFAVEQAQRDAALRQEQAAFITEQNRRIAEQQDVAQGRLVPATQPQPQQIGLREAFQDLFGGGN